MNLNRSTSFNRTNTPNSGRGGGSSSSSGGPSMQSLLQHDAGLYRTFQQLRKTVTCSICLEVFTAPVTLPCNHSYCKECVQQAIQIRGKCPMCSRAVKVSQWKEESSGYMKELLEMLRNLLTMIDPQQNMISCSQDLLAGTAMVLGMGHHGAPQHHAGGNSNSNTGSTKGIKTTSSSSSSSSSSSAAPSSTTSTSNNGKSASHEDGSSNKVAFSSKSNSAPPQPVTNNNSSSTSSSSLTGMILSTPRESSIVRDRHAETEKKSKTSPANEERDRERERDRDREMTSTPAPPKIHFEVGSLVNVLKRTWAGMNRLGGVGRVENRVDDNEGGVSYYRVKYVLDGSHDDNIHELFVEEFKELDRSSRRRPSAGTSSGSSASLLSSPKIEGSSSGSGSKAAHNATSSSSEKKRKASSSRDTSPSPSSAMMMSVMHSPTTASGGGGGGSSGKKMRPPLPLSSTAVSALGPGTGVGVAEGFNVGRSLFTTQSDIPASSSSASASAVYRILTTSIDDGPAFDKKLEKFAQMFHGQRQGQGQGQIQIELESHFTDQATHLIVSVEKQQNPIVKQRTMKYMMAIAHGLWIVSTQWVLDCLKHKELLSEEKYEVMGNVKATRDYAPRRSRLSHVNKQLLLAEYRILLFGGFPLPGPPKSDAMTLSSACGAEMVTGNSEEFMKTFYHFTMTCEDSSVEYDTLMNTEEEPGPLDKWLIICSNCGGCCKEMVSTRLKAVLEQVMVGENPVHAKVILERVPIVNSLWLIDSVTNYQKLDFHEYLL